MENVQRRRPTPKVFASRRPTKDDRGPAYAEATVRQAVVSSQAVSVTSVVSGESVGPLLISSVLVRRAPRRGIFRRQMV